MSRIITQPWMKEAFRLIGTEEVPGGGDNDDIITWAQKLGGDVASAYGADSIPWCGLFTAHCIQAGGFEPVDEPLWALNWANYGYGLEEGAFGAVLAFSRDGGGHVGFMVGHDEDYFHVLGGNQSDMVCIAKVAKDRCKGIRWPLNAVEYFEGLLPLTEFKGPMSTDEL